MRFIIGSLSWKPSLFSALFLFITGFLVSVSAVLAFESDCSILFPGYKIWLCCRLFFYLNLYLLYLLFSVGQILGVEALCFTLVLLYGRYHYVLLFDLGNFGKVSWASLLLRKIENDGHLTIFLIIDQRSLFLQLKNPPQVASSPTYLLKQSSSIFAPLMSAKWQ